MIKIKVKEGKGETEVDGAVIDLIADAGVIIWALKDMIKREQLMPNKEMKAYLTALVLADNREDVVKFLGANMGNSTGQEVKDNDTR